MITIPISRTRRDDDQLVERARIAYTKSGGREQPSSASDVTDINGAAIITLRNVNGPLARYRLDGDALTRIPRPYAAGTAQDDALYAGIAEGHAIWRAAAASVAGAA